MTNQTPEIDNRLGALRQKRGFSAAQLAGLVGVSRQTIYAIEAGSYMPNTALALKLARVLESRVEELFALAQESPAPELRTEQVMLLPGSPPAQSGQPVQLCSVDQRTFAAAPSPVPWYFPASDAVIAAKTTGRGKARVQVFQADRDFSNRILVAGCDPAISVLSRHVQAAGIELVLAHRNSSQALTLLKEGCVHVAGTHLRDDATGESNIPEIGRRFSRGSVAVVTFAVWEEGIVTARNNPKGIHQIEDFARKDVRMINREAGAGSRRLIDAQLQHLGIQRQQIRGYDDEAQGHLPAAWQVLAGRADCCIATRGAARLFGLAFIPLATERYDLAIRRRHLGLPAIQMLLDTLNRTVFRRELETLGGYDTTSAGERRL
jgi:molybdate-binding protein/DNA-binding XRE family transcriptional regulator